MESGNPNYANLKRDVNRFGFSLDSHVASAPQVTDLGHLIEWRNKAAPSGVAAVLLNWRRLGRSALTTTACPSRNCGREGPANRLRVAVNEWPTRVASSTVAELAGVVDAQ